MDVSCATPAGPARAVPAPLREFAVNDTVCRGLAALEARLAWELEVLGYPPPDWIPPSADGRADVVVIGAGMCGLVAAFALRREGVARLRVLDAARAGREGPWITYARMDTLRSPKHLAGPALGVPSLTFRAWFEAQWGAAAWETLGRIPREQWMDYLVWYRRVLALPVESEICVRALTPEPSGLALATRGPGGEATVRARKVVLATGREGLAHPRIPEPFAGLVGPRCQHSSEAIDFAALAGRCVAVIGLGASAFDNAGAALEAGAAEVHLLARAAAVPRINKAKQIVYPGFTHGFPKLPLAERAAILGYIARCRVAPPRAAALRVARHAAFRLHLDAPVTRARAAGDALCLETPSGALEADHAILATGFRVDLDAVALLAPHAAHIARLGEGAVASGDEADEEIADHPALGPAFELTERTPGEAPWLGDVHCFNHASAPTHGNVAGDIPAVSEGAARLARELCAQLFVRDAAAHYAALERYEDPELEGDELATDAWWPPLRR